MDTICQRAIELVEALAAASARVQTSAEKAESAQMARMMDDASGKAFTLAMVDRVFRSHSPRAQARRLRGFLQRFGTPSYLPAVQKFLLSAGAFVSRFLPGIVMRSMENELRRSSARVILAGETKPLHSYLESRKSAGTRVNLNHLGEAVLGEEEAKHRLEAVLGHLADPAVDYISVKISAIFSQINIYRPGLCCRRLCRTRGALSND
jgi:RHH-type transcriptional regulator, proline utilization regulon repressor / proline dehydrogenase / delta 1-pyrroline-5-carboxylate dehydrogenase